MLPSPRLPHRPALCAAAVAALCASLATLPAQAQQAQASPAPAAAPVAPVSPVSPAEAASAAAPNATSPAPSAPLSAPTTAAEASARATLQGLIDTLVQQGLLTRARAEELLRQGGAAPAAAAPDTTAAQPGVVDGKPVIRVPYLPETARQRLKDELREDVLLTARAEGWANARMLPDWLRRLDWEGDLRVRGQFDGLPDTNTAPEKFRVQTDSPAWAPDLTNTQHNRYRLTLRARLGLQAQAGEQWRAGLRLGTGTANGSPTAASQTLGNDFGRLPLALDRAWLRWSPSKQHKLEAGRIEVPFDRTDLTWPDDVSMDGMAGRSEWELGGALRGFAAGGLFALEEFANTSRDKNLLGAQIGLAGGEAKGWQWRASLALYDFRNIEGVRESQLPPTGGLAGTTGYQSSQYPAAIRQKGNTLINLNAPASTAAPVWGLASKFRPLDLTLGLRVPVSGPLEGSATLDVVKNTAFDLADISSRANSSGVAGLKAKTLGYQLRLGWGHAHLDAAGDWTSFLTWRHLERDAWVDAFTDTTWHLGGTNYQGFSLGGQVAVDKRASLGVRLTSTRNLDDGVRALSIPGDAASIESNRSSAKLNIDVFQVEATIKF